jgi:hypothetical protein
MKWESLAGLKGQLRQFCRSSMTVTHARITKPAPYMSQLVPLASETLATLYNFGCLVTISGACHPVLHCRFVVHVVSYVHISERKTWTKLWGQLTFSTNSIRMKATRLVKLKLLNHQWIFWRISLPVHYKVAQVVVNDYNLVVLGNHQIAGFDVQMHQPCRMNGL